MKRSIQRQLGRALDHTHRDVRMRLLHVRALQQVIAQEALVAGDVLHHHLEHEIHVAGHGVALQHLGKPGNRLLELRQITPPVA